jgi:hypothetical protein
MQLMPGGLCVYCVNAGRTPVVRWITMLVLFLPVVMFSGFLAFHGSDAANATFALWMFTTVVCFIRGLFILRRHRRLAWCCIGVALLQIILAAWCRR